MAELTPAPEEDIAVPPAAETAPAVAVKQPLPQSILILGGIAIALLITVLVVSLGPGKGDSASDKKRKDAEAEIKQLKEANDRLRMGLPLSPEGRESAEKLSSMLQDEANNLSALAKKAADLVATNSADLATRTKALNDSQTTQKALADQIVDLRQQLGSVSRQNQDAAGLQAQLQAAIEKVNALTTQVLELRQAPVDLQKRLNETTLQRDDFARQVRELQARLAKINLFAGSEADINKEAQVLYRSLISLEGQAQTELARAYSQYSATIGSTALDRVAFATGSSSLGPDDLEKLRAHVEAAPDNAFFFVVGYASKTGSADDNRKLSSARATAVATALADLKKPNQRVQAAYLGQTDRFGATPELNQISELWQIVPRE